MTPERIAALRALAEAASPRTFRVVDSPWPNRGKHFDCNDLVWEHESNPEKLIDDDEYSHLYNIIQSPGGYFRVRRMLERWQRRESNNAQFIAELEAFLIKELTQ